MSKVSPEDSQREARHHFELYHVLRNRLGDGESWKTGNYTFDRVEPEEPTETGFADLVVYDGMDPWLVVECKKLVQGTAVEQFDPYSSSVIKQASRYADDLGAEFIATYNGETLVLLRSHESHTSLLNRRKVVYELADFEDTEDLIFSVLGDIAAITEGLNRWDEDFDVLVRRLRELHQFIYPKMQESIESKLEEDDEFATDFVDWANEQGMDYKKSWIGDSSLRRHYRDKRDDVHNRFVREDAYLLINQLIFYKIVEDSERFRTFTSETAYESSGVEDKILTIQSLSADEIDFLRAYLRARFDTIVEDVDYKAVFEQDDVFGTVPLSDRVGDTLNDFIDELSEYDLSDVGTDFLGSLYEGLIPEQERKELGEFYTPESIGELIVEAVMENPDDVVLDPAVGTGTFPIKVYKWIKQHNGKTHQEIIDQIAGADVNRFAAHLAVINLARQNLDAKTERTNIHLKDFFLLDPEQHLLSTDRATLDDDDEEGFDPSAARTFSDVNVVVGNPPYINRNQIPDKKLKRKHLPANYTRTGGDDYISKKSDIYQYFFTKGLEWLDDGGRLGFITSYKWTTIDSGKGLMRYFLNNTRIKGIIGFNKAVFEDALVNTYVTLLEKRSENDPDNQPIREDNRVPFVRIEEQKSTEEILDILDSDISHEGDGYRVILRSQAELANEEKWNRFIVSPTQYFEVLQHDKITRLPEVCDLDASTGTKTQADDFFVIDAEKKAEWQIPDQYLTPALISKRQINEEDFRFERDDTDKWFLDLHDVTLQIIDQIQNSPITSGEDLMDAASGEEILERKLKEELRENGHERFAEYIDYAKRELVDLDDPHANIYGRGEAWWDLGELQRPKLIMTETRQHRPGVIWNVDRLPVKDVVRPFYAKNREYEGVIAGILNSALGRIFIESHGRMSGGRAIRMMVYDLETLPIIDLSKMSENERDRIEEAFMTWLDNPGQEDEDEELDRAVLASIGMENRWEEIQEVAERMMNIRNQSGEVQVLVGDREKTIDISDAVSSEAQTESRLTDFT